MRYLDIEDKITEAQEAPVKDITEAAEELAKNSEDASDYSKNFFTMPEGSVDEDEIVDKDFWKGLTLPEVDKRPKKGRGKRIAANMLMSVVFLAVGFGIACVSARGRGVISNLVTGGKHMTFTMPVNDRPEADDELKDEKGRYTAQGIAEICGPSVVSLDIFSEKSELIPMGKGSGIIISEDGYIVSNAHVVDKGTQGIKVVLSDGREYAAEVIGSDPKTDIAVIKIPAPKLTPAEFGNSDQVKLGEDVVCVGSPAGYRHSLTKGIVSGTNRIVSPQSPGIQVKCIQVDAAVNPGDSGGAMFNMWGQVIGITSSKLADVDYEGIGFAIATNDAKQIVEDLMEYGEVQGRARIGITYVPISKETAELTGATPGLKIDSIDPNCDVSNTELKEGDLITAINGTDVTEIDDFSRFVSGLKPGDEATCHVVREIDGGRKEFDITFKLENDRSSLTEAEE